MPPTKQIYFSMVNIPGGITVYASVDIPGGITVYASDKTALHSPLLIYLEGVQCMPPTKQIYLFYS